MQTLENSEDPDEMPHNVAFHQGLHCLPRKKQSREKYNFIWKLKLVYTSDFFIWAMANIEDPDEMPHTSSGSTLFTKIKQSTERNTISFGNYKL